jgi:O-methyltransferase
MLKYVNKVINRFDYEIRSTKESIPPDIASDVVFGKIYAKCRPFTMTTVERMFSLHQSVKYIIDNNIPGNIVECGVWKGGSSMVIAETLQQSGVNNKVLYLYDTYEGMNEPTEADISVTGERANELLQEQKREDVNSIWCYSTLDEVKKNMSLTGYPAGNIQYIKGKVEETIPGTIPGSISLLRLDTDWYESTKHELIHLYPLLSQSGILIIDDFGYWQGAKKAVLEYLSDLSVKPLLHRIDATGRLVIKPGVG